MAWSVAHPNANRIPLPGGAQFIVRAYHHVQSPIPTAIREQRPVGNCQSCASVERSTSPLPHASGLAVNVGHRCGSTGPTNRSSITSNSTLPAPHDVPPDQDLSRPAVAG